MPIVDTLAYATILFGLVAICAAAANDAATGAASVVAAVTTNLRSALLLAAVGFAFGMLLLDAAPWARMLDHILPLTELQDNRRLMIVVLASLTGTAAATLLATWACAPAPIGLFLAVALAAVGADAGARISIEGVLLALGASLLVLLLAGVVAFLVLKAIIHSVLRHARPRDRLSPALPIAASLTLALAGLIGLLAFDWAKDRHPPWPASLVVVVLLAAIGFAASFWALRAAPLRFTNDLLGAEAAFRRLQIGGAALVAAFHGAAQTLLIALPLALAAAMIGNRRPQSWTELSLLGSGSLLLPLLCAGGLAVTLAGHRTSALLGERLLPTAAVGGVAINFGVQGGALVALALGLPVAGGQAATGGFLGVAAALRPPPAQIIGPLLRLLAAWVLGPIAAATVGLVVLAICRAWIG